MGSNIEVLQATSCASANDSSFRSSDSSIKDVMLATVEYGKEMDKTRPDRVKITTRENAFTFATFVVMGTAAMAFWNTLIGCLYSVQTYVYPDHKDISDTITAVFTTMTLLVTAVLIRFQILNIKFLLLGASGFVISSLGIALTCQSALVRVLVDSTRFLHYPLFIFPFIGFSRSRSISCNLWTGWFVHRALRVINVWICLSSASQLRRGGKLRAWR